MEALFVAIKTQLLNSKGETVLLKDSKENNKKTLLIGEEDKAIRN